MNQEDEELLAKMKAAAKKWDETTPDLSAQKRYNPDHYLMPTGLNDVTPPAVQKRLDEIKGQDKDTGKTGV